MLLKGFVRKNKIEVLLFFLLIISLGLKLYRLSNPKSYYFDEIYYAFTAEEMAKGNRAGWEVGHTAPKGFAYEWSNPHLGKELSAIGILIFGDNAFGWRFFQAIFGGFGTLFIYLLGKELFQSKRVGLIAAFLFTFESFIFVLSRIAMVDIFLMSFVLIASLFLVKFANTKKDIFLMLTGVFCGAAISVKWSGIYALEFLAASSFLLIFYREAYSEIKKKGSFYFQLLKIIPKIFLVFVIIPFAVYLASYIPFFLYGNSFNDFISLQNNMYGYHKGLTATHPYQSSWWKWPLLLRSVYLYLGSGEKESAHIYAIGNPFIWWSGCVFLILSVVQVIRKELPALAFVPLSVFAYWLPWALSPRKLVFLYHFLPSLPFVILIIAYFLDLLWSKSYYGRAFVFGSCSRSCAKLHGLSNFITRMTGQHPRVESFFWLKSLR